ncbi:unnamed protein product, partial [Owenia fusiformis]
PMEKMTQITNHKNPKSFQDYQNAIDLEEYRKISNIISNPSTVPRDNENSTSETDHNDVQNVLKQIFGPSSSTSGQVFQNCFFNININMASSETVSETLVLSQESSSPSRKVPRLSLTPSP